MGLQDGYQERQLNQMAHQEQLHPGQLIDGTVDVNSTVMGIHNVLLDKWPSGQIDTTTGYLTVVNYRQAGTGAAPITDAQLVDSGDAYEGNFKVALTVDVGAEGSGSTAGKIDFFLNFGSGSAGINGYMFEIDYTSGDYAGTIYRVDNGVLTNIGTQKQAVNAAQLNGWKHATIQYHATGTAAGKMAIYVAGHLQAIALDTTYTGTYLLSYAAYGAEGYIKSASITAQHELPADTFDPNLHPLIDFSQSGHLSKNLDNVPDGTTRKLSAAAQHILSVFPSATPDVTGGYIDVTNVQNLSVSYFNSIQTAESWSGNIELTARISIPSSNFWQWYFFDASGDAYLVSIGGDGTNPGIQVGRLTSTGTYTEIVGNAATPRYDGTTLAITIRYHSVGRIVVHVNGKQVIAASDTTYTPNGPIGFALSSAGTGYLRKVEIRGHTTIPDNNQDTNQRSLIDFSQSGHIAKILDNIADGTTYARPLATYLKSGRPYNFQGAWSSTASYNPGDEVSSGGNYYLCVTANSNSQPPNANWQLLGPTTLDVLPDGTTYKRVANVSASNLITTASVTPAAINNIAIAENTSSQAVTTTVVSGTTPPTAPSTWTQVASVALNVASSTDYIRLQALVTMTLTNFFLCASNYALKGSTPTTVVYDQIWARIRETTTNTVVWQTTSGQYFGNYTQIYNGSSFWYASNMACGLDGPIAGVPGAKLITGLSGSLNFVLEIGATDMTKQYVSGSALSVTVTDAYIEAWDIQR